MRLVKKWTPEERGSFVKSVLSGESLERLSTSFERSRSAIYSQILSLGLRPKWVKARVWGKDELLTLSRLAAEGKSDEEIGAAIGRTAGAVAEKREVLRIKGLSVEVTPVRLIYTPRPFGDPPPGRSALEQRKK